MAMLLDISLSTGRILRPLYQSQSSAVSLPSRIPRVDSNFDVAPRQVFDFKWIRDAPQYATDLSVYVWQSFAEAPKSDEEISVVGLHDPRESLRRVIMFVKTPALLDRFRKVPLSFQRSSPPVPWQYQAIEVFQSCLELKYQFRRYPSGTKIQYLQHVKDCLNVAEQATDDSLNQITMLPSYLEGFLDRPLDDVESKKFDVLETDFTYIRKTLIELHMLVDAMSKNTRQMLELAQIRRSFLLTIAAAVYIPLSFVSYDTLDEYDPCDYLDPDIGYDTG
ncbi:hypothetical protein K490DRAFT_59091 [Saccharata proteae CBS 121410]|uniref:Uncharacterized protein n=1 Tax=Saccharata proteae CBS 121410 TaxID=1314787 RepID=A0A9P4HNJ3_9PEZI|nr:hypothetical protein K490DRAFT_59091 [Saccharata proteae CBS 121410]